MDEYKSFLHIVEENLNKSDKDDAVKKRILDEISKRYKDSDIFHPVPIVDEEDEYREQAKEILKCSLGENTFPLLEDLSKEERIRAYRELYKGRNPFPPESQVENPINERGRYGRTQLHEAVNRGDLEEIKRAKESGADPFITDNSGCTPFKLALLNGDKTVVEFLKSLGIDQ